MSDFRSPVYSDTAKVRVFAAASVRDVKEIAPSKRGHALNAHEQLEEAKRLTIEAAEKLGRERGHSKGFLQGYEQGKEIGRREAQEEAAKAISAEIAAFRQNVENTSQDLQTTIAAWFEASEQTMTDLAMSAVRNILCSELELSRDSAVEIVKDALKDVTHSRHARIKINPFDSPSMREHRQEILSAAGNLRDVEFVSDGSISGGCVIETDGGVVDATTETKLVLLQNEMRLAS